MSLKEVVKLLDWYPEEDIKNPSGMGAKIFTELLKKKIARTLKIEKNVDVEVGVLVHDPYAETTQTPIAIVCEFNKDIDLETLNLTHQLSWNFCRSPLLIIVESTQVRALSCYKRPEENSGSYEDGLPFEKFIVEPSPKTQILQFPLEKSHPAHQAAYRLQWAELFSGQFFKDNSDAFPPRQRVDYMLLENLRFIREELHNLGLAFDIIHDLLARLIFIQFLFQRKDSEGNPAIDSDFLRDLRKEGVLFHEYRTLAELLRNKDDAYDFFKWLNNKFNGDLFPGQGETREEREREWKLEMDCVKTPHLNRLAEFVAGDIRMRNRQRCFWQMYSFDVIPLEFISSIYEVFVSKEAGRGVHYTPGHLVDFILDSSDVLPWDGKEWNLKILDPACGSGIFLVKAFQRLVQRWKNVNPNKRPDEELLTGLLKENLSGTDVNPQAVRVASFSLYLAMCDEIDPRRFWMDWEFPRMREKQIKTRDFFDRHPLFEHEKYDIVLGNAPWGRGSIEKSASALKWAKVNNWTAPYKDIGPLFLPKAAELLKSNGVIAMIQPVNSLLLNETAKVFRKKFFRTYKVTEITNLSALRYNLFNDAISPSCIVICFNSPPDDKPLEYVCPKSTQTIEDKEVIFIEPRDTNLIFVNEAIDNPYVWTTLMWGSRRDLNFMNKLGQMHSLQKLLDSGEIDEKISKKRGIERGEGANQEQVEIIGRKILDNDSFPGETFLYLDPNILADNINPWTRRKDSTGYKPFEPPQLILKLGWQMEIERFRAAIVSEKEKMGVICSASYVSFHHEDTSLLESACLTYNSKLAVYFLLLISGQFASYRPKITVKQALSVPFSLVSYGHLKKLRNYQEIDDSVCSLFDLKESEKILIDDLFDYTLPDFKGGVESPGRKATNRIHEDDLIAYCEILQRVIKAAFGADTRTSAKIFEEESGTRFLPLRMIQLDIDVSESETIEIVRSSYEPLWSRLRMLNRRFRDRIIKVYETPENEKGLTIYFVKPDQKRHWLRSQAYQDADRLCAEISQSFYVTHLTSNVAGDKEKKIA